MTNLKRTNQKKEEEGILKKGELKKDISEKENQKQEETETDLLDGVTSWRQSFVHMNWAYGDGEGAFLLCFAHAPFMCCLCFSD